MLSQYDRQQLELISSRLHIEDPEFAKSFRDWQPRPEQRIRRWPFVVLMVLAGLVCTAGVLVGAFSFIFLGTLALAGTVYAYRRHTGRAARVRTHRRRQIG